MSYKTTTCEGEQTVPDSFPSLLEHLGPSLVDLFFLPDKGGGLSWVEFARGYVKCCGRMSASMSYNTLLRVFHLTAKNAGFSSKLEFESDEADCKINGSVSTVELVMFLWMCWAMSWDGRRSRSTDLFLPDISHLVMSALVSCTESGASLDVWDSDVLGLELELPVGKLLTWALTTIPSLTECLSHFCNARLQHCLNAEVFFSLTCCFSFTRKVFTKKWIYRMDLGLQSQLVEMVLCPRHVITHFLHVEGHGRFL